MGITANFLKLRSSGTPKLGEWNINYDKALALAKQNGKFIVTCWSNGDLCSYCKKTETCMMEPVFTDWMKTSDAYFVFQYSGDKDKGKSVHDWVYKGTGISQYPGFRITLYEKSNTNKMKKDFSATGNTLRNNKTWTAGAKEMVANLSKMLSQHPAQDTTPASYKIRFNEKLTVKKVNKILDAIDANHGYCPCQVKSEDTKCQCKDFIENKKIGEPCICNLYMKQKK